ncbi:Peptidoglycan/xylan/chitin deacetylase, PgdA/CDA1 family [Hathewaya proteolytica DSM 3090]|uniref:Peptidoglycan/xylan/chitin deacetylase, PgdA/CDA1 family n=1 Tax=Hathewaya proteolytica DSM 3090 TaxID=1121331 RepID=A0A1M6RUA6_9CLOT|nr:polysaccharide deacetylase family protein [Hathewaya proteolytica]SHK36009.1 Peptidoglycan/xylan/chitin deacetylase, PgdA/CDA1 family [Hathewaya proteolytica DSM 3090]
MNIKLKAIIMVIATFFMVGCTSQKEKVYNEQKQVNGETHNSSHENNDGSLASKLEEEHKDEGADKEQKPVEMVDFVGNAEHLFFHPLIAYNELAFDGDSKTQGMDDWFVTVKEFKSVLEQLYKNNYILIDIESIYSLNNENNKMERKSIKIPKGKKPIILSIDDMNYYDYMRKDGTIHKLILDHEGKVAAYTKGENGEDIISYDNSIVPILDNFVEKYPDFSLDGVKATIGLTGYEGILGYRTQRDSNNRQQEIEKVMPLVKTLKENGWKFASHSYGHPDVSSISLSKLKDDTDKWEREVKSLIGETSVYIYPFGSSVPYRDPKFQYLKNKGFSIFCAVGPISYEELYKDVAQTDRRHCDGITLRNQREKYLDLYDAKEILDIEGRKVIK